MTIRRKDFQKAAAFLHEFLLKLNEDPECAELRDALNLGLLYMQKYYRKLQIRIHEKNSQTNMSLSLTARGLSPLTPFVDAPDRFQWKWINLDNLRGMTGKSVDESVNMSTLPPLINAVKEKDFDLVEELIENDASCVEQVDGIGRTALVYAVHFQEFDVLKLLLESGCNVNATSHDGSTALHQACHDSNHKALSLLLQYGGDFTIQDVQGRAPIHWACTTKSSECLKYLIGHHADVNARDKDGITPCMWACRLDHIKHFEHLSSSPNFRVDEADGIERDINGRTWMHWSIRRSEPLECLQTLLTRETASIRDEEGKTVLLLAAEMGSLLACKIIVEIAGKDCLQQKDRQDRTALHLASIGGHGDIINYLLDNGMNINGVDKFNASAWDYARNRQLHYCQLIIMSHQRQRLQSNPTSPIPNGMGLSLVSGDSFMNGINGDMYGSNNYDHMTDSRASFNSTRGSFDGSMPITPPHPPKRPRTSRTPIRRSQSLASAPEREPSVIAREEDRYTSSAGGELQQRRYEDERYSSSAGPEMPRGRREDVRYSNSAGEPQGSSQRRNPKERIEVNLGSKRPAPDVFNLDREREDVPMVTDERHDGGEEDIDNVSVGGMDVSDIDDEEDEKQPATSRIANSASSSMESRPVMHPRPPPRFQPRGRPKPSYAQPLEAQYGSQDYAENGFHDSRDSQDFRDTRDSRDYRESRPREREPRDIRDRQQPTPQKYPLSNTRVISPHFHQPANQASENFPPARPRPAPRYPPQVLRQPPRPPPPRRTPSPVRPSSGIREHLQSPPSNDQMKPTPPRDREKDRDVERERERDTDRPNSGSKVPGVVEGRRIPPPMLTPLENAPVPPNLLEKRQRKKKKKRRERQEKEKKEEKERENDMKSPPMDLQPPRGYAAPLHPPPSATTRSQRVPSGIPAPRPSKHQPQRHESRYVDESIDASMENMDVSRDDDSKPPVINGYAVPVREGPSRSSKPVQPMESDEYEEIPPPPEAVMQEVNEEEEEDEGVGPLIPPPQGFRGTSSRPHQPRSLSQSVPQDNRSARMIPTSAKPPLPSGGRSSAMSKERFKSPSPHRRSRSHTGSRSHSVS